MDLRESSKSVLDQLVFVLDQMKADDYGIRISSLNASIGQHVRHILEFYICLFDGINSGVVNYDKRKRDLRIENDKQFTLSVIEDLKNKLEGTKENVTLSLELKYGDIADESIRLSTNYSRELVYNIEHTIHHLAIIKNAINDQFGYIDLPDHFGIASSTVRHINQKYN